MEETNHEQEVAAHKARIAEMRAKWSPGPWTNEPDRVELEFHGFPALIVRAPGGNLCGYVGVPPGHPWHGKGWNDALDIDVHGGVTYAEPCAGAVCHVPKPGEPENLWWIGFDCAHLGDIRPNDMDLSYGWHGCSYKDIAYVTREVESLAKQALEASRHGGGSSPA